MTEVAVRQPATTTADLARIAVVAALIAVLGLPGTIMLGGAVPITAQTLGVMLAGAVLGSWRGAASVLTVLALVALGLPLLAGGRGGLGVFVAPSVGYLLGWVVGAFLVGVIVRAGASKPQWWRVALGSLVGGMLAVYAVGIPLQSLITGLGLWETVLSSLIFVPGDLIKVAIATVVTMALWRAYPRAFAWPQRDDA
ncbi:biotin transporter BioY [Gulosibacter sp. ACHW.36C]|uniref:Biotin transporter n=1 Tax=Gulosibacter sediminis TaxID=1729695 RepID=A0ABY4MTP6_9MICO|nr:biotin transporter BioY [Gulosibacter sediminis]UQN13734.1 biotin transporter BioY [Gulosibacter sediminis]